MGRFDFHLVDGRETLGNLRDSLGIPPEVVQETSVSHDAAFQEIARYVLALRALPPENLRALTEALIRMLLPAHRCTLEQVSLALGLNPRTLQRRLAGECVDFEGCLDAIRRRQAEQLLRKTNLAIGQISTQLGYRRTTSFCRAHQRWFEMTPLEHRRQFGKGV